MKSQNSPDTKESTAVTPNIDDTSDTFDDEKKALLLNYLDSVFPPVYDVKRSVWSSMYDETIRYHPYITVFNWKDKASLRKKLTTAIQLLTSQSMLMFLMAVFIDLEVSG